MPNLWRKLLALFRPQEGVAASFRDTVLEDTKPWSQHRHPCGFRFRYPPGWTVSDDVEAKSTLLNPSPGKDPLTRNVPKAICIVKAYDADITDPKVLKTYFENELSGANITSSTMEDFPHGAGRGVYISIDGMVKGIVSGLSVHVVILRGHPVTVMTYGPRELREVFRPAMTKVAVTLAW